MSFNTEKLLARSCVAGYENLVSWTDLLDRINVYPVADGDTGTNLRVSFSPLRDCTRDFPGALRQLAGRGIGNSGNIGVAFIHAFLSAASEGFSHAFARGREEARKAVHTPVAGTMLDVFDVLPLLLDENDELREFQVVRDVLKKSVSATCSRLQALADAGVIDAGALGIFLFLDGFFQCYLDNDLSCSPVMDLFRDRLKVSSVSAFSDYGSHCVEVVVDASDREESVRGTLGMLGDSAVMASSENGVKIHLHTSDPQGLQDRLAEFGPIVSWSDELMTNPDLHMVEDRFSANMIRIVTDAAGSIPCNLAREHGIIILDSYIVSHEGAFPESLFSPDILYPAMRKGQRFSTAQASNRERLLRYQSLLAQYGTVLYICTGSSFTGNMAAARKFKEERPEYQGSFHLADSGAASGRLAVIALLSSRLAAAGATVAEVVAGAGQLAVQAEEYVFIDELRYLVAGGRVSKAGAFFGDLLNMKPVISPGFNGVQKAGLVRNRSAQVSFCIKKLEKHRQNSSGLLVLLQYTDNRKWLEDTVQPEIGEMLPDAETMLVPLSLTSGVHMGPGTWSVAFGRL